MKKVLLKFLKTGFFVSVVFLVCFLMLNIDEIRISRAAAIESIGSGDWDNAGTWDSGVPGAGDTVTIKAGHTVTITAGTATRTSWVSIDSLTIEGTGVLTHSDYTSTVGDAFAVNLNITGTLTIDDGGSINVEGKGYEEGKTYLNADSDGDAANLGGSHGGYGYPAGGAGVFNDIYDSVTDPSYPGGGSELLGTKDGGGVVQITADTISISGTGKIDADGEDATSNEGGGAGGTVNIDADTITYSGSAGTITADGGDNTANNSDSGGGGGRIAISYDGIIQDFPLTAVANIHAFGGNGYSYFDASAGTVYLKETSQSGGDLYVRNTVASSDTYLLYTVLPDTSYAFDTVVVGDDGRLVITTDLDAFSTTMLQADANGFFYSTIDLSFADVSNSSVYPNGGEIHFNGDLSLTNFTSTGVSSGTVFANKSISVTSDSINIASGLTLSMGHGTLTQLDGDVLDGAATIIVDDGTTSINDTILFPDSGTIYIDGDAITYTGRTRKTFTGCSGAEAHSDDDYVMSLSESSAPTLDAASITVGGILTHREYNEVVDYKPQLVYDNSSGTVTISNGGAIDVEGKGYMPDRTNENIVSDGNASNVGGSHGGYGYPAGGAGISNSIYDSVSNPILPGGGGENAKYGGGLVQITADTLSISGTGKIDADGEDASGNEGGGAGGTVNIDATTITYSASAGTITADGGDNTANNSDSGGGGGRIAIYYTSSGIDYTTDSSYAHVYGGNGYSTYDASAGTVFVKQDSWTNGELHIDNNSLNSTYYTPIGISTQLNGDVLVGADTITVDSTISFPGSSINIKIGTDTDITCTGKTPTAFTGCSNVGAHSDGDWVRDDEAQTYRNVVARDYGELQLNDAWEDYACSDSQSTSGSGAIVDSVPVAYTFSACLPGAPTTPYCHSTDASAGDVNPVNLTELTPVFSAICNSDADDCITAEVQVDDDADLSADRIWDSAVIDIADIADSVRSGGAEIEYSGSALSYNTTYYWRIRFSNAIGAGDWFAGSSTFLIPNNATTVSINSAASKTDGTGTADISIELDDSDLTDTLSAQLEYKLGVDCSSGTSDPTLDDTGGTFSADSGTPTINNSVTYQVSSLPVVDVGSNTILFDWLSATDAAAADGTYCLKATPYDSKETGVAATTTLTLDNVNPTASGDLTSSTIATDSITYTLGAAGSDTNINQYTAYYKAGASGVIRSDTLSDTIASGAYTQGNTTQVTSLSANTQYVTNIWTEDSYGNNDSATEVATYTAANAPGTSTVDNPATTTLDVALDINSNPAITEFAIQETGSSNYIQADNSLGAVAAWQDNSTWSTATVTDLSPNTTYVFQTKARNGDSVETDFGTTANLYTLAEVPGQPTIDNLTTTSLDITLASDNNPSYTNYAIQVSNGTASYVQADGTLGASEVWQDIATWDTTTVVGLTSATSYTAQAKARNEDSVETSLSGTGSGDTGEEVDDGDSDGDEDGDTSSEDESSPTGGVYKERTDSEGNPVLIDLNPKILTTSGPGEITRLWTYNRRGNETDVQINEGLFPTSYLGGAGIVAIDQSNNLVKDQFALFATSNGGPQVRVMSLESNGTLTLEGQDFLFQNPDDAPGTSSIRDGLSITTGDFDNDGFQDDIAGCLTGDHVPRVKIFRDATGVDNWELLNEFDVPAIGASGCNLSTFQYDDGLQELLITPNHGPSDPNVYIYTLGGTQKAVFLAYDDSINQGLTASGISDRIYTTPNNGSSHVRAFNRAGSPKNFWWAYDEHVRGNFKNVSGDIDLDGKDEILISPMGSNGTQVLSFEATGEQRSWPNFFAFDDETLRNGVGVAVIENWQGVN